MRATGVTVPGTHWRRFLPPSSCSICAIVSATASSPPCDGTRSVCIPNAVAAFRFWPKSSTKSASSGFTFSFCKSRRVTFSTYKKLKHSKCVRVISKINTGN